MRRLLAALGAAVMMALGIVASPTMPAHAENLTPMARFGSCVAGGGQGHVLMLFDKSGSLQASDPSSGRLAAAKAVVSQLTETVNQRPDMKLDLAIAGFSEVYEKSMDWTPVSRDSMSDIQAHLDGYTAHNTGPETDYWTALDGARQEFAALPKGEEASCKLLLWFSDGAFDIEPRPDEQQMREWGGPKAWVPDNPLKSDDDLQQAIAAAEADMCREGGLADQMRALGVVSVGLGLAVDVDEASFDLMRNFVTGGGSCGKQVEPVPGQFVMATNVNSLVFEFITSLDVDNPNPESVDSPACVGGICPEGTRTFVLDDTIGAVSATAQTPAEGTKIYLQPRVGDAIELTPGTGKEEVQGATLKWQWISDVVLTMHMTRTGDTEGWAGPWGMTFVAEDSTDEMAKSSISLKGDITPTLLNDDVELRAGEGPVELEFGLVGRDGERIDPATLSEATSLTINLITSAGTHSLASGLSREDIEKPVEMPLGELAPGQAQLVMTLDVTTQDWNQGGETVKGTRLEPRHSAVQLTIEPGADLPSIPSEVDFGSSETADPVTARLPIEGEGCVWLAGETTFTGYPSGQENAKLASPADSRENCVAEGELELTLDPEGVGNGSFIGSTKVMLAPRDSNAEATPVDVAFTMSQSRPASQPVLISTLIGVTLLGVAIPLGILYLAKFMTATIPGNAVLGGSASGPVDQSVAFTDNGVPIAPAQMHMAHVTNKREVTVCGKTLRAKMGLALTEPGYVVVETPGPSAGGRGTLQSVGGNAKLPLGVQGTWMVELDPQRPASGPVLVTVFTGPGAPGMPELFDDIRANIRTAVEKLREGLPPDAGPVAHDPWGGGGGGQPASDPWATPQQAGPSRDPWAMQAGAPGQPPPPAGAAMPPNSPPPRPAPPADPWASPPPGAGPGNTPQAW